MQAQVLECEGCGAKLKINNVPDGEKVNTLVELVHLAAG